MGNDVSSAPLRDLLVTTKDGDWGRASPAAKYVPYRVIRGTDFPRARIGDISSVPIRYLKESTVHRRTLRPDDILIETAGGSRGRPTGRSLLITGRLLSSLNLPATCASFARFLRVDLDKANPRYIYWYLQHLYANGEMEQHQVQHTGVARFQYTTFAQAQWIPLPPPAEQRAIAHILGTLDDKIELNRRMNKTLEGMARVLFKSWFVDFDPVRAKAAGRDPGLPRLLAGLFPDRLVDSELGMIPAGWGVAALGQHFMITMGQSPPGSTYNEDGRGLPFYQGRTDFGFRFPTRRVYCTAPTRFAEAGDTLITVRAPVGSTNMAIERCSVGRGVAAARHSTESRCYTYYFMQSLATVFDRFEAEGTVFGSISKRDFHALNCAVPPANLIREFELIVKVVDDRIEGNERESRTLGPFRDTLLHKLISGALRVKDGERSHQEIET